MDEESRALFEYSRRGDLAEVQAELAKGVLPDGYLAYDGTTPLLVAARQGHAEVVAVLLSARADVSACGEDGGGALCCAAVSGRTEVVRALLRARAVAHANEDGVTPLGLAQHYGHLTVVELLRQVGDVPGAQRSCAAQHFGYDCLDNDQAEAVLKDYEASKGGACARRARRLTSCCLS